METGAEAVEGSLWERGEKRETEREWRKKDWELADAEESTSGHLTQIVLEKKK